jgi:hypothetical protein
VLCVVSLFVLALVCVGCSEHFYLFIVCLAMFSVAKTA